jgi:hypothetical protein
MLNQVSRALAQLFRPISSAKSDADRDPSGNAFEKFTPPKKEEGQQEGKPGSDQTSTMKAEEPSQENQTPLAQVIPFNKQSPEEVVESRKREIRNSQAFLSLVNLFQGSKTASPAAKEGPDAYEQGAGSKKGVIVDKKAG